MKVIERLIGDACVLELESRHDCRGSMKMLSTEETEELLPGFVIREQRIYTMPEANTFFGIHFQSLPYPQAKLVAVLHGKGLDYVIDLRKESDTYRQWKAVELSAEKPLAVLIPAGFGHAFLSLEKDTVQFFAVDQHFVKGYSKGISYLDPEIGLKLPCENPVLSEADRHAPFLREL
ncbi:MAG: dTDP-4-dehydrorhamnose 3,5-epimerase family protein [Clostridia bacterium]|nr:dTDP-4-dehydrorhamnose 3,5-epimerase family protein [Clostridia bacterium]